MLAYAVLVILGLCFGSFINALVWRVHEQAKGKGQRSKAKDLSILKGRSMCPHCGHELAANDLVPVISWLFLRGKCRYCSRSISPQYPLVEAATALWFVFSYAFWPETLNGGQWVLLITWLATSVGLIALAAYDFRWQLLPNRILYPTFYVALAGRLVYIIGFAPNKGHSLTSLVTSLLVASGIFWLLFTVSEGKWIGFGDVRLGLISGTVLADPFKSLLMIFLASVLGTLSVIPALAAGRKGLASRIPFGPFLILSTGICVLYGDSIINWYQGLLGL
jgi:prepilin signal peptidase PulO-like enzyme (type II secretory pathway)